MVSSNIFPLERGLFGLQVGRKDPGGVQGFGLYGDKGLGLPIWGMDES